MHGFFGSYGQKMTWNLSKFDNQSFVKREHSRGSFCVSQITLQKFLDDKYFIDSDGYFLATEGVLLEADTPEKAIQRYKAGDRCFWDSWRGSFCGLLYDQQKDTLLIFNDHIGSKMLFYTQTEDCISFASDLRILTRTTNSHTLNDYYAHAILNNGCNNDNSTFVKGIFRLTAGQYLEINGTHIQVHTYHTFDNTPWTYDERTMIQETNRLFRQAVSRVVKKNDENGLKHFFPLSGGLDSRMAQWVARQLTQKPITNFTYSQTGHYDHLLPQEISRTLGNEWQFMALDGGDYITSIDGVCEYTEWLVNYMQPVEPYYFAKQQNWEDVGIVLTGINGDNIFATETDNKHEMARIYTQGFNGYSLGSPLIMQHFTETYSPFCDVDVLDYVLHISTIKRRNYHFYDQFVLTCYPEAAQWHHKYMQIGNRPAMVTLLGRNIPLRDVPKRIGMTLLKRLHIYDAYRATKEESMNPYDYWCQENPKIEEHLQHYYQDHLQLITNYSWFSICEEKMRLGTIMEKGKVLTVQSAITQLEII